jgi:hypothetical protein
VDDDPRTGSGPQHGDSKQKQYNFTLGHTCTLQAPYFPILSPTFGRLPPPRHWAPPAAPCVKHSKGPAYGMRRSLILQGRYNTRIYYGRSLGDGGL